MAEFNENDHQLFRSHFLNADQLAGDAALPSASQAADAGAEPVFEPVEREVENGWLNIRIGDGEWASVKDFGKVKFDPTQQGRIPDPTPPSEWSEQPSYADPVADGMDPTAPDSPESQF